MPATPDRDPDRQPEWRLLLASTSPYRRALLQRLRLPFTVEAPEVDETAGEGEVPAALALRLASAKATAVAQHHRGEAVLVIGSDQVAECDGAAFGKPGDLATAASQLARLSGRRLDLHTGLCVISCEDGRQRSLLETQQIQFRQLDREAIARYLAVEQPLDAAGSFYAEGYGIVLFESCTGRDPNSIVGLPLMGLVDLLRDFGVQLP